MKGNELLYKMELIDHELVEEANGGPIKRSSRKRLWVRAGALAACLSLALTGAVILRRSTVADDTEPTSSYHSAFDPPKGAEVTADEGGVTIPKLEVNLNAEENAAADMIGFFIYGGRCYVEYDWFYSDGDFAGEYLGYVRGLIDEWTPKEGYVDFAGSTYGDIYTVKGYDPSFMLCTKNPDNFTRLFICDNGITLKYGSELFEHRLRLSENLEAVEYETNDSWYHDRGERYGLNSSEEVIARFIVEMDGARFMLSKDARLGDPQYRLYFKLRNGITLKLRLYENGYVEFSTFSDLSDICVQVPEESYTALTELIKSQSAGDE